MADRSTYLENTDDQIASQKRMEQQGRAVASVGLTVGAVAAFVIGRRKVSLARAFSADVKATERSLSEGYSRYILTEIADTSDTAINRFNSWSKNLIEAIQKPIPTGAEQLEVGLARLNKSGLKISAADLPTGALRNAEKWGPLETMVYGPIAAIAHNTPLISGGVRMSSGRHGALVLAGNLLKFRKIGKGEGAIGAVSSITPEVHAGIAGSSGSRLEFLRAFNIKEYKDLRSFTKNVVAPMKSEMMMEHTRHHLEGLFAEAGIGSDILSSERTSASVIKRMKDQLREVGGIDASARLRTPEARAAIQESYQKSINSILEKQVKRASTKRAYRLYQAQMKVGVGEPFASFEAGEVQGKWRKARESLGMGIKDPVTGRPYRVRGGRYIPEGRSVSGTWKSGSRGQYYMYPSGGEAKRATIGILGGTFMDQLEQATGWGINIAPNKLTNFISSTIGASKGSYGEFAVRKYVNTFGRLAVVGGGAFTAYKLINYIAHQTVGWGIDDTVGKLYTTSREFQQKVIDQLGMVDSARKLENAFPGLIKSPLAMIARATAPYWMTRTGGNLFGKFGAQVGLALGIATALLSWGDITQSPEELHRIYTGQQDIPVRKGRWWMFGKTPFGGGKVMYWRPHWYPMMRSRYKYRGQLWDSETEEMANTGILAPVLSPLLTGKMWDPYHWEKKHYYDRPYPVTGELFEPTMPFAWLGNSTIGNLIKPQRAMHPEYFGAGQQESGTSRTMVPGAGSSLGMGSMSPSPMVPNVMPDSPSWRLGEGMYAQTEQMGIRGFLINQMSEEMTGRSDFLPKGPVAQSARRATGYERSYWDLNIGDPGNFTEFFRRVLPHRRRAIEEYNPIGNTMPDWMPGGDYFTNFKTGDPYTKVEVGEARLPGPGYESLHRLHSGIPHVYDAVDRFLILSDIAPYSKEYSQYKALAMGMTRKDPYWSEIFKRHIEQRAKTQEEYEFLEMTPPEDVTGLMRPLSSIYRKAAAFATGPGSIAEPIISAALSMQSTGKISPFFMAQFPISKYFPYKTAAQTYKDYRLQGSEFTEWGNPMRDFIAPYANKVMDTVAGLAGQTYIPPRERERREYEEYFDKLQYAKYKKLSKMALDQGNSKLATQFNNLSAKTMVGTDPFTNENRLIVSLPKRERAFVGAFSNASPEDRAQIESMVSPEMARIYRAQWSMRDGSGRGRVNTDEAASIDVMDYFRNHNLPSKDWAGWHPDVDLKDVQLKVVRNEGMNIHNFDLWESQERSMERRPYVPSLGDINMSNDNSEDLRRSLHAQLENDGYTNVRSFITRTPASQNSVNLKLKVKRDRSKQRDSNMRSYINA